jgi:hypothetical protein
MGRDPASGLFSLRSVGLVARIRSAGRLLRKAGRADPVCDEVAPARDERVEDDIEVVPQPLYGAPATPRADRHPQGEKLPRRHSGSRGTGCAI